MKLAVDHDSEEKLHGGNHDSAEKHLAQYRGRVAKDGFDYADK